LELDSLDLPPNLVRVETEQDVPVSQAGRGTAQVRYPKPKESSVKIDRRKKGFRKVDLIDAEAESHGVK
jgi:hypothetical protein